MNETIQEFCQSAGGRIDRERGIIRGCKILGTRSRNSREYPIETLRQAAPLYENCRVFADHDQTGKTRRYEDLIGSLRSVQADQDGLHGDFHLNMGHKLAPSVLWMAEHDAQSAGFSHCVTARTSRRGGKTIIEEITKVCSVDLVADPATTNGLFEGRAAAEPDDMPRDSADFAQRLRSGGRPTADFAEKLRGRGATTSDAERADFVRALLKGRTL